MNGDYLIDWREGKFHWLQVRQDDEKKYFPHGQGPFESTATANDICKFLEADIVKKYVETHQIKKNFEQYAADRTYDVIHALMVLKHLKVLDKVYPFNFRKLTKQEMGTIINNINSM